MIATGVKEPQCQITNALSSSECCESLSVSVISAVQEHREKNRRKGRSRHLLENLGDCTRARALLGHCSNLSVVCGHIVKEMVLNNSSVAD